MSCAQMTTDEVENYPPKVVFVNDSNKVIEITDHETHGEIK